MPAPSCGQAACLVRGSVRGTLAEEGTASCQPQRAVPSCPLALPCSTPCCMLFASLTQSRPSGTEQSPCLCLCQVLAGGGGGAGRREEGGEGPGLFRSQAPRFPLFQEGASSLTPPSRRRCPPFPLGEQVKRVLSGPDCTPGRGGEPTRHHRPAHTPTVPRLKRSQLRMESAGCQTGPSLGAEMRWQ